MAKIAFAQMFRYELVGTMTLSAILKANGHQVEIFVDDESSLYKRLEQNEREFDLIGFSLMTCHESWMLEVSRRIKELSKNVPTIVGGPHPTFFPDVVKNDSIDMICKGEGEYALLEVMNAIDQRKNFEGIPNISFKNNGSVITNEVRPLVEDLEQLPFPDRTIYQKYDYFKKQTVRTLIATRGCPFKCNFCFNHQWNEIYHKKGPRLRLRSPENIFAEVDHMESQGVGIGMLFFVDSTFNINRGWCLDFFKKYKGRIKYPFSCNFTANLITEDVVQAMAETGLCYEARFAVEVGNERLRKEMLRKPVSNEQIIRAGDLLNKYKIPINSYNMFGVPTETKEQALETIEINKRIKPIVFNSALFGPFPGLDVTKYALEKGLITQEDIEKLGRPPYTRTRSVMRQKDIKEISNIHKLAVLYVKLPWLTPILNRLINLPENVVFDYIYRLAYAYQFKKHLKLGFLRMLYEMFMHRKEID